MLTLPDPRHEAFATLRASGHDLASAYVHAGYSVKNIKQRSRKLQQNPNINARIAHLKTCLPRIEELHAHHCPSLRLMPETRHEMLVWLWQVMNGTRLIKPAQMRAATLYCRMRGWHLAKLLPTEEPAAPAPTYATATPKNALTECEEVLLAMISLENIEHERTGMPIPKQKLERFQSLMADHAHPSCRSTPLGVPIPEPAPEPTPGSTSAPVPETIAHPTQPTPESAPPNPIPVNPANPEILSKKPVPATPPKNPQKSPTQSPSQPALPQRLISIPSPTPHKFSSPPLLPLAVCSV